jgi:hypothetical protein
VVDLINTILVNKVEHHFPIVKGHWTDEIMEVMNWKGINPIPKIEYKHYYQKKGGKDDKTYSNRF